MFTGKLVFVNGYSTKAPVGTIALIQIDYEIAAKNDIMPAFQVTELLDVHFK